MDKRHTLLVLVLLLSWLPRPVPRSVRGLQRGQLLATYPVTHVIAVLSFDNNLSPHADDVIEKFRQATTGRTDLCATLLVDRFGESNTRVLFVQGGSASYESGIPWLGAGVDELDTADPDVLADFLVWAHARHPDARTLVSLMGHGTWVGPDFEVPQEAEPEGGRSTQSGPYPSQPRGRDFTSGDVTSRTSLSTPELGSALLRASENGATPFDLVFFDQCFTGNLDTLYEVRHSADYFIASPNYAWATHAYDRYLAHVQPTTSTADVAQAIVEEYQASLDAEHPNAIFWVPGASIQPIADALSTLADALLARVESGGAQEAILSAVLQSHFIDTTLTEGDLHLAPPDQLVDLSSLATQLRAAFPPGDPIEVAAAALLTALGEVHTENRSGTPWAAPYATWDFTGVTLSVVAPLTPTLVSTPERVAIASLYDPTRSRAAWLPDPTQQITISVHPAYVREGRWDDFIATWYAQGGELEPVAGGTPGLLPARFIEGGAPQLLGLQGSRTGTEATLTWSESALPDAVRYVLYVKWPGMELATWLNVQDLEEERNFTHEGLVPGEFVYLLTAQDAGGIVLAVSNPLRLTVPEGLVHRVVGNARGTQGEIPVYSTIQAAIDHANPGDVIQIATGTYHENVRIDAYHHGLTLEGGYEATHWTRDIEAHPTIIDGGGGYACVDLVRTHDVTLSGLRMTNAERLVRVYPAHNVTLERNYLYETVGSDYTSGIDVESNGDYHTHDIFIRNNVIREIRGPGRRGGGIDVALHQPYSLTNVQVVNNTLYNISQDAILMGKWYPVYGAVIENNIIARVDDTGIQIYDASLATADYNAIHNTVQPYMSILSSFNGGPHDLQIDPLFIDASAGDLHLQSGSPCIDAGNPAAPYNQEPYPNGERINLGAYGNTEEATPSAALPLVLAAEPGLSNIALTWTATNDPRVSNYRIYRRPPSGGAFALAGSGDDTHYFDDAPGLISGTTYAYYVQAVRSDGRVAATSNVTAAPFGRLTLAIPDVWGESGEQANIPIDVRNAGGLSLDGADIWLTYNPALLAPVAVTSTALTADYLWEHAIVEEGLLHVMLLNPTPTPLHGDGALFWLTVEVLGTQGESSALGLLPFGEPGTALYADGDLANALPLILEEGLFHVDAHTLGDLNDDGLVNVADVLLALHFSVGSRVPEAWQRYACDANNNGACDPGDAAMLWYRALHLKWPLVEASGGPVPSGANTTRLSLGSTQGIAGQVVEIPIYVEAPSDWAAGRLSIAYDPLYVAEVVGVSPVGQGTDFALEYGESPGLLQIAMAQGSDAVAGAEIARVQLRLRSTVPVSAVTPLKLATGRLYDVAGRDFATSLLRPVERGDGTIDVRAGYRAYLPLALKERPYRTLDKK